MSNVKRGDRVTVNIRGIGSSGEGVGDINGFCLFIDGALPGEKVNAEIEVVKKNYGSAKLQTIQEPSPNRENPVCPLFGTCGGCQLMHLNAEGQLQVKTQRVKDAFSRVGNIEGVLVNPCIPSPQQLYYRNKIQLMLTEDKELALYRKNSHEPVPIPECFIHCQRGETLFQVLREEIQRYPFAPYNEHTHKGELRHVLIRTSSSHPQALIGLITTGNTRGKFKELAHRLLDRCKDLVGVVENVNRQRGNRILGTTSHCLAGRDTMIETLCGMNFEVSLESFMQVNPKQAEQLYQYVMAAAELQGDETVLDAYCGIGTLALIASQYAKKVIGIECVSQAIGNARKNAEINGVRHCEFMCGLVENTITTLPLCDVVILNPPRKGCEKKVIESLIKTRPEKILYISCDPATLARDVALLRRGGYRIDSVQPFDMFPQTMHVETVVRLSF